MSIMLYDPIGKTHVLLMKKGSWAGRRLAAGLSACDNPCCRCRHIYFECSPADAETCAEEKFLKFTVDAEKRIVSRGADSKGSAASDAFAEAVVEEMDDKDWEYLFELLINEKQKQIENCDIRSLDAAFPPEVLRYDRTVVGYEEIFPLVTGMDFSIGQERWVAVDDYCVHPGCDCREAILQFFALEQKGGASEKPQEAPPAVHYNYETKSFSRIQDPGDNQPSMQELMSGLKHSWRGMNGELKKRHRRMKALFKKALSKSDAPMIEASTPPDWEFEPTFQESPPPVRANKIGRNNPCPCGSGKKFKKCCGA